MSERLGSSHQRVRRLRRLVQKRALRWSESVCVLEGPDLILAALGAAAEFEGVYVDAGHLGDPDVLAVTARAESAGVRVFELDAGVLAKVADAQSPQPVIAAVRFAARTLMDLEPRGLIVVMHDVRDPGNAGTVIRTADAVGARAVVMSGHSVDPYNPKTLRASAGSIFHVDVVVEADLSRVTSWFSSAGGHSFATVVRGGEDYLDADLAGDVLIVIGNESEGLDEASVSLCDRRVSIEMAGRSESLNLAVATGVVLFEALSQRRRRERSI